jgi:hypothetical protein
MSFLQPEAPKPLCLDTMFVPRAEPSQHYKPEKHQGLRDVEKWGYRWLYASSFFSFQILHTRINIFLH